MDLSIAVTAFDRGGCPANPESLKKLLSRVKAAASLKPEAIWLDHFRFDGRWEAIKGNKIPGLHQDCQYCQGLDRSEFLSKVAEGLLDEVPDVKKVGYFAVPFKDTEVPELDNYLGQNHQMLGRSFDMSSPMLYHRMIKRPVSYISEYVKWISEATGKPVLPIIQIKDMPDDLEDKITEGEIKAAFNEAQKEPSVGVAIFWWQHALEKNKTGLVSGLFSK
jgi:hypothetical protein